VLDFGGELSAVKANRADSRPASLNADIASLDITFAGAGLSLPPSALDALGTKVVWLEFHWAAFLIILSQVMRVRFLRGDNFCLFSQNQARVAL